MAKRKRLNKNLIVGLTAFAFVVMTSGGVLLVSGLSESNPERFAELGEEAFAKGNWDAARSFYARAYTIAKDSAYLVPIGDAYMAEGDEQRAVTTWRRAVADRSDLTDAYSKLLSVQLEHSRLFGLDPSRWLQVKRDAEGLLEAAETAASSAEGGEATDATDTTTGLFALGVSMVELARQQQQEGNQEEGYAKIRESIAQKPAEVDFSVRLANYLAEDGKIEEAGELYRQLVAANDGTGMAPVDARIEYARFLAGYEDDLEDAREVLNDAKDAAGDDKQALGKALTALARAALIDWDNSRRDPAIEENTAAVEEARRHLEAAVVADPDGFEQYLALSNLYRRLDKLPEAIQVCEARLERPIVREGSQQYIDKSYRFSLLLRAAELFIERAVDQEPGSLERQETLMKALELVNEAEAENQETAATVEIESRIRMAEGKIQEAKRLCEQADEAHTDRYNRTQARKDLLRSLPNKLRLARLYMDDKDWGAAKKMLDVIVEPGVETVVPADFWVTYARILFELQELQKALGAADRALQRDTENLQAMLIKAQALSQLDREDEARQLYARLAELGGEDVKRQVEARQFGAQVLKLLEAEQYEEAAARLLEKLKDDPGNEKYAVQAAHLLYTRLDRKAEATAVLKRALETRPDSLLIRNLLVRLDESIPKEEQDRIIEEQTVARMESIEDEYERALALARYYRVRAEQSDKEQPAREADARQAMTYLAQARELLLNKTTPATRTALPDTLEDILSEHLGLATLIEDYAAAGDVVDAAIRDNADHADGLTFDGRLRLKKGEALRRENKQEEAAALFEQASQAFAAALNKQPTNSATLLYYGQTCLHLKRLSEAQAAFEQAADVNPRDGRAWKGLAVLARAQGDEAHFLEYVAECRDLIPNDPAVRHWILLLDEQENPTEGIARREERREQAPADLENLTRLAALYAKTDQNAKAEACYAEALAHENAGPGVYVSAAAFYGSTERVDRGREILQQLVASSEDLPTKANNQLLIGDYYASLGQRRNADTAMLAAADIRATQVVCVRLGEYFFQTGRLEKAEDWLEKALQLAESSGSPQAAHIHRMIIQERLARRDPAGAQERYDIYIEKYPNDVAGLRLRAELELRSGRVRQAIETLGMYLEKRPDDSRALYRRAQLFGNLSQWERACQDLEELRGTHPTAENFRGRMLLARGYALTGRPETAETELRNVLEQYPHATNVAQELLQFLEQHDKLAEAETLVTQELAIDPDDPYWLVRGGRLALQLDDPDKAIHMLKQAVDVSKFRPANVTELLKAYLQTNRTTEGISFYDTVPSERRTPDVMSKYALLLCARGQAGDEETAVRAFCLAIDLAGDDASSHLPAVAADVNSGLGQRAIELLSGAMGDDRLERPRQFLLAAMLTGHQRLPEAIDVTRALLASADSERERGGLHVQLGQLLGQAGQLEQACAEYEKALEILPDNFIALNNLAYVLAEEMDQPAKALVYAKQAASQNPQPETLDTFGWVLVKLGRYQDAISELTLAIQRDPYFVAARAHLGEAFRLTDEFDTAVDTLELAKRVIAAEPSPRNREYQELVETALTKARNRDSAP